MQYSPKLKNAMDEMKEILIKYDIGGSIILHDPSGHSEYLLKIDPSYSCARFEGDYLRVKSKLTDYDGDKDAQKKSLTDTINMISHIKDISRNTASQLNTLEDKLKGFVDFEHTKGSDTSHTQQNN